MTDKPNTKYSDVDTEVAFKRTVQRQVSQEDRIDRIETEVLAISGRTARLPFIEDKINLALRPRLSPVAQVVIAGAAIVGAAALLVIAFGVTMFVRTPPARASVAPIAETAGR